MNFDYIQAMADDDEAAAAESAQAEAEQRLQFEEIQKQFERLWKKHGLSKKAYSDEEIAPFKYVALKWYMRGRFNE